MKENKKNNSFLFGLYHKLKKDNAEESEDLSGKQPSQTDAAIESLLQPPSEAPVSEPAPSAEAVPSEEPAITIPRDKLYLEPLFDLHTELFKTGAYGSAEPNLLSFEKRLLAPICHLPTFQEFEKVVHEFLRELSKEAKELLASAEEKEKPVQEDTNAETEPPAEPAPPEPVNASVRVKLSVDQMYAFLIAIPPMHGGAELTDPTITAALKENYVSYGIRSDLIRQIIAEQQYMQIFLIAQGTVPVDGENGQIINKVDCSSEIEIQQDDRGVADFKNLNMIHSITKDQVICEIIPPVDGIPGMDVTGRELPAKNGNAPTVPCGKNTMVTADGTQLISMADGQITYKNNRFIVEPVLLIKQNVDYGIGNIDFMGDVIIYGDVCNGFTVKAGGSVTVRGMVESATIIAGSDVIINKGMNGNFNGSINAGGSVKTTFLENCKVYVEGNLQANSIVACEVYCGDSVIVQGNQGVIIGGSITAYHMVQARIIGSKSRRETSIILGEMPHLLEKKTAAQTELKSAKSTLEKVEKNVKYLTGIRASLPPEKVSLLIQLEEQQSLYRQRVKELEDTLAELNQVNNDYIECRLQSNMIFPPTKVSIGPDNYTITVLSSKCNVFLGKEGIEVGTL